MNHSAPDSIQQKYRFHNQSRYKSRKRFGQNFLHDHGVINRIIASVCPKQGDHVVEIGPGRGALTDQLLDGAGELDVIELDRDLIPWLKLHFGRTRHFRAHEADALHFDFQSIKQDDRPLRIVGNLPYNISTPLIFHLFSFADIVKDMHFMLQKEVVERLCATHGDNHYGRLSVMARYYCRTEYLFQVGSGAFCPAPEVDSAMVRLIPWADPPHPCKDIFLLETVVKDAFGMRRKTLRNSLKRRISASELTALDVDPSIRPERMRLESFVRIADYLAQ